MSHLKLNPRSTTDRLDTLYQNPHLASLLAATERSHPHQVATLIEPILQAPNRCRVTPFYIQAIATGETAILITNLSETQELAITNHTSSWLMGRSPRCAIAIPESSISRCHAAIGCYPSYDFYITDVGSSNGTRVNHRRLAPLERQLLQDGDLIQLGSVYIEFFLVSNSKALASTPDATATHY